MPTKPYTSLPSFAVMYGVIKKLTPMLTTYAMIWDMRLIASCFFLLYVLSMILICSSISKACDTVPAFGH